MIAALLILQAATSAVTAVPGFERSPPMAEERIALPHVADALRAANPIARRASLDTALYLLPKPTRFRGAVQCLRGAALLSADVVANKLPGSVAIDECHRLNPDVPLARRMRADTAFLNDDVRTGATLLAQAISADSQLARGLKEDQLDTVFRQLGYAGATAERRALVVALSKTDAARDNAARYSGWVRAGVLDRVEKGDLAGAGALLPYIVDPADALTMLVDRRYEPLWPRVDEWAGGDLVRQRDALVAAARAAHAADPELSRARALADVLARTGHAPEAVTVLTQAVAAFGTPRDDYDYARAVVKLSGVTAAAGERDARRILAPMRAALAGGVAGPMLVNVVPNLAISQIALDRPADALATLDRYPIDVSKVETAQAFGYFVAIRGCAEAKLGRAARARAALATVTRDYAANLGAVDLATGCIGDDAQVLARWLARVDDPDTRSGALLAMYGEQAGTSDDRLAVNKHALRAISTRAEVRAKLAQYGRAPAAGYLPAMRGWRATP
jgi:hypothetical protein